MTEFKLKSTHVEVHQATQRILGVEIKGGVKYISYEQFYSLLNENHSSEGQGIYELHTRLIDFFGGSAVTIPENLVKIQFEDNNLICTQIFGGPTKVFKEANCDTSRVRVDYVINSEKVLLRDSVTAYRYRGITHVGDFQEDQCTPLPKLTEVIRTILYKNKTIPGLGAAKVDHYIRNFSQRVLTKHPFLEEYMNTDIEIPWEDIE